MEKGSGRGGGGRRLCVHGNGHLLKGIPRFLITVGDLHFKKEDR